MEAKIGDKWQLARLIPVTGIGGGEEQERRATSALLATLSAVREFGRAVLQPLGAPAGHVVAYIEVPFDVDGKACIPDGLITVRRGAKTGTALVEVKTSSNALIREQVESYLDVARVHSFDGVLTISNEIPVAPGAHPVNVDKRKLRHVNLWHLPWTQILTDAVVQKTHRGVSDPDQAWLLGELIRYLEHPKSGAMEFSDMGPEWVTVRDAARAGTLRRADAGAIEVVNRWEQLVRYVCLRLGRELGADVQPVLSRAEQADPLARINTQLDRLTIEAQLDATLRIPDTAGDVTLTADLRAQQVSASITVDAPREGRAKTRVTWLLRQCQQAPDSIRIDAYANRRRTSMSELLGSARANPELLIEDPRRAPMRFVLTAFAPMGMKRGVGRGSFIDSLLGVVDGFYASTVQHLRAWTPAAPKMKRTNESPAPVDATSEPVNTPSANEAAPDCRNAPGATEADATPADSPEAIDRFKLPEGRVGEPGGIGEAASDPPPAVDSNPVVHESAPADPD